MCATPQLVSAPLNPIPTAEHLRRSHPQCEHSYGHHIYMSEQSKIKTLFNELNIHTSIKLINNARAQNNIACAHVPRYN